MDIFIDTTGNGVSHRFEEKYELAKKRNGVFYDGLRKEATIPIPSFKQEQTDKCSVINFNKDVIIDIEFTNKKSVYSSRSS
jgi:hypothetical protein